MYRANKGNEVDVVKLRKDTRFNQGYQYDDDDIFN